MSVRRIVASVKAITGERVVIGEAELAHAMRHFTLPRDLLIELIKRVLQHPSSVLVDDEKEPHEYRLFYRLEDGRYILAVVKVIEEGAFFASMYPTGTRMRRSHGHFRRLR